MKIEIITNTADNPVAKFFSSSSTPETDVFIASQNHSPTTHQLRNFARIFEQERDEAREELKNEMKWHHQTHKELVEAQCKLLDIEYDKLKS